MDRANDLSLKADVPVWCAERGQRCRPKRPKQLAKGLSRPKRRHQAILDTAVWVQSIDSKMLKNEQALRLARL